MNQITQSIFYIHLITQCFAFQNSLQPPLITEHPTDVIVKKNEPATLNCKADGVPPPTIEWYKDGEKVVNTSSRMFLADRLFFLRVVQNEKNSDTGTYWCVAKNAIGKVRSQNATLGLAYFQNEFRKVPKPVNVVLGDSVIIECSPPRGYPEPVVTWKKDGKVLNSNSSRIKMMTSGSLKIATVRSIDKGKYSCRADNILGFRESLPASLNVYVKPFFIKPPANTSTLANESVELECKVEGDPSPSIIWTKKDGVIPPQRAVIKDDKSLQITHTSLADQGIYICEAENLGGIVSAQASIFVYSHPKLTILPQSLNVAIDFDANFECHSEGSPKPLIFWTKEGSFELMFPDSNHGKYVVNSDASLTIFDVKQEDQGYYYCTALSIIGSSFGHSLLTVTVMKMLSPPIINFGPYDQFLKEESIAILPCEVSSTTPAQIKWLFNDQPLSLNEHRFIVLDSGTLQIDGIKESDSGVYTCLAINNNGESLWSGSIMVKSPLDPNVIFHASQTLSKIAQPTTKPIAINVTNTSITLTWSLNDQVSDFKGFSIEYYSSESPHKWTLVANRIQEEKYTIHGLSTGTSYVFIVRVENSNGLGLPSLVSDEILTLSTFNQNFDLELNEARNILSSYVVELKEVTPTNSTSIEIKWIVAGARLFIDGYIIRFANIESQSVIFENIVLKKSEQMSFILTGLKPYSNYKIFVSLFYKNILGPTSNLKMVQTPEGVPSSAPTSLAVQVINETNVEVSWHSLLASQWNGFKKGYLIQIESKNFWFKNTFNTSANNSHFVLSNLTYGQSYNVQVAAFTIAGFGPFSEPAPLQMKLGYVYKSTSDLSDLIKDPFLISFYKNPMFIIGAIVFVFLLSSLILIIFVRRHLGWKKAVNAYISVQLTKCDKLEKRTSNSNSHKASWLGSDNSKFLLNGKQLDQDLSKFINTNQYYLDEEGYYAEVEGHSLVTFGKTDSAQIEPYATTNLINTFEKEKNLLKPVESKKWSSGFCRESINDRNQSCFEQFFRDSISSNNSSNVRDSKKLLLSSTNSNSYGHCSSLNTGEINDDKCINSAPPPPKKPPPSESLSFLKRTPSNITNASFSSINHDPIYSRPYSHEYLSSSRFSRTSHAQPLALPSTSNKKNRFSKIKNNDINYQSSITFKPNLDNQSNLTYYKSSDVNKPNTFGNLHLSKNSLISSQVTIQSLSNLNLDLDHQLINFNQSKLDSCQKLEKEEKLSQSDLQNCDNKIKKNQLRKNNSNFFKSTAKSSFQTYQIDPNLIHSGLEYDDINEKEEANQEMNDEEKDFNLGQSLLEKSRDEKLDQAYPFESKKEVNNRQPQLPNFRKKNYSRKSRIKNQKSSSQSGHQLFRLGKSIKDDYFD